MKKPINYKFLNIMSVVNVKVANIRPKFKNLK